MNKDFEELTGKLREAAEIMQRIEKKGVRFCTAAVRPVRPDYPNGGIELHLYSGIIRVAKMIATGTCLELKEDSEPVLSLELPEFYEQVEIIQLADGDGVIR